MTTLSIANVVSVEVTDPIDLGLSCSSAARSITITHLDAIGAKVMTHINLYAKDVNYLELMHDPAGNQTEVPEHA